ncbi:histone family protein [Candidatus Woesearchaeota archaeon]|nr:histone family protein [Candidatus Woesearchaeota archaeon]
MAKKYFPVAAIEQLMKRAGAERVSDNAKDALKKALEEKALILGEHAVRFAAHAGRKTVKAGDIKLAAR